MNKRVQLNLDAKNAISDAFFQLLGKEQIDDISVTQIADLAGVSRMAYYRNFHSKADIIQYYLDSSFEVLLKKVGPEPDLWTLEYGKKFFKHVRENREMLLTLNECGYSGLILDAFNRAVEEMAGDMPFNSIDRYKLYCAAGASFNAAMLWLKGGCKEGIDELNRINYRFIESGIDG